MSKFMSNEEIDRTIEGLHKLIDIYATELYNLDQQRPKDNTTIENLAMAIYRWQLRVDKTYEVIEELKKYKNLN